MGYMTSADCTLTKLRMPESPRSSSCVSRPYFDVVHAGAAVAVEGRAVEAELAHGPDQFAREAAVAVALLDDGDEVVFDEGACVGANEKLVLREQGVELDEINALKLECHSPAILDDGAMGLRAISGGCGPGWFMSGLQPSVRGVALTWGYAPGCDGVGPLAL